MPHKKPEAIPSNATSGDAAAIFRMYYRLTKPGIIYGNVLTAVGGFLFAAQGNINFWLLLATIIGMSLVIASACVFNNYIDRDIDAHMKRTSNRALVLQAISNRAAITYAITLGIIGIGALAAWTNHIVVLIGITGFVSYVFLYTFSKRKTWHSTLIGTISGATPIVAGYAAASGQFDLSAIILFAIMVIWQMAHFYAIAIFRKDEYEAAGVPVITVVKGLRITRAYIVLYIAALLLPVVALFWWGTAGYVYLVVMTVFVIYWLVMSMIRIGQDILYPLWARQVFGNSLLFLLLLSLTLSLDAWLP